MSLLKKGIILLICAAGVFAETTVTNTTTTTTTLSPLGVIRQIRQNKTAKDADLVIKMTQEFVKDMRQKMIVVKRVQRTYDKSSDFTTASVYSDIQKKFRHMCDLYKEYALVRKYIMGYQLNKTHYANPDVVAIYQFILSDYDEIHMLIEHFKLEQEFWQKGEQRLKSRELIAKQMEKFGSIPANMLRNIYNNNTDEGKKKPARKMLRWAFGEKTSTARKWTGGLDGRFDDSY